jgi:hypothetical protein
VRQRALLTITGIEWVIIVCLAAFAASWLPVEYRSVGIEYMVAILGYLLLSYLLMDVFIVGLPRGLAAGRVGVHLYCGPGSCRRSQ